MRYTQEQIDTILADAEVNGFSAAAKKAGVTRQTVSRWDKKAGKQITPKKSGRSKKETKPKESEIPSAESAPESELSPLEIENSTTP